MANSFLLASQNKADFLINQLHINLWFLDENRVFIDVGLDIVVPTDLLTQSIGDFRLYTPFKCRENSAQCLGDLLISDKAMLKLVFNQELYAQTEVAPSGQASYIQLRNQHFLLLQTKVSDNDSYITITPNMNNLNVYEVMGLNNAADNTNVYVRIRFEVDIKDPKNIYILKTILRKQIIYDFRFNEKRLFSDSSLGSMNIVGVRTIYIFVIQPIVYKFVLKAERNLRYIRALESNSSHPWSKYIPELERFKRQYLVYSWKGERTQDFTDAFRLLVSYEIDSDWQSRITILLIIALISYILLVISRDMNLVGFASIFTPYVNWLANAAYTILIISVTGMLGNVLWDIIKHLYYKRH